VSVAAPRRILVLAQPLLGSLVREIAAESGRLEIVAVLDDEAALVDEVLRTEPDVLIVGLDDYERVDLYLDLLESRPRLRILALTGQGRETILWELRPQRTALGEISPETLLAAVAAEDWRAAGVR